tara:strand:+ start:2443 stop:2712 length:270 start_codon:yes stop_codon:yes gene_type:complete
MGDNLIVPGMVVNIKPLSNACSRTKNRIRERGEWGFVVKNIKSCVALDNRMSAFLMGQDPGKIAGDQWLGWLPLDEIEMAQRLETPHAT